MTEIVAYSFGQASNGSRDYWYAGADGKRIKCDEDTIQSLWNVWVMSSGAKRADDKNYHIFVNEKGIVIQVIG